MKRLKQGTATRDKNSEEHILPLINVVFLLLIFFMIAGRLTTSDPFQIEPSKSLSRTQLDLEMALIHLGDNGRLAFQNIEVSEAELYQKIEQYMRAHPDGVPRLKVSGTYPAGKVLSLMTELKARGVEKVSLITKLEGQP